MQLVDWQPFTTLHHPSPIFNISSFVNGVCPLVHLKKWKVSHGTLSDI